MAAARKRPTDLDLEAGARGEAKRVFGSVADLSSARQRHRSSRSRPSRSTSARCTWGLADGNHACGTRGMKP